MFLIYFGTSTLDEIAKDTKMKLETMIGVIGGTCGLLTGFSILSGVEILYYATLGLVSLISAKVGLDCPLLNSCVIQIFQTVQNAPKVDLPTDTEIEPSKNPDGVLFDILFSTSPEKKLIDEVPDQPTQV